MNFEKYFATYNDYARVQKKVAQNLCDLIPSKKFNIALELGCGTGVFTESFLKKFQPKKLILNDYYDVREFLPVHYAHFLKGDIENIALPNADIIISSSVFQWMKDLDSLLEKLAKQAPQIAFSIYLAGNLIEIAGHFGVSLNYLRATEIEKLLQKYFRSTKVTTATYQEHFISPFEALKHLKYSGVTNIEKIKTLKKLRKFQSKTLTYQVGYFLGEQKK